MAQKTWGAVIEIHKKFPQTNKELAPKLEDGWKKSKNQIVFHW